MSARLSLLPMAVVLTFLAAPYAGAQSFFGEFQMFRDGSMLSLDVTLDSSIVDTADSTGADRTDTESKTEAGAFRYEAILFHFGSMDTKRPKNQTMTFQIGWTGKRDRFKQTSSSILQDIDDKVSVGYAGLGFNGIGAEDFDFYMVASRSSRSNLFTYFDYKENQDIQIDYQYGAILSLGIIQIGAVKGEQLIDLIIVDPGRPFIRETYDFEFEGTIFGFHFHLDDENSQFNGIYIRKNIPFTPGLALDMGEGVEKFRALTLILGGFVLQGQDIYRRQTFVGEILEESREKEIGVGMELEIGLTVSLKLQRKLETQEFIRLNNPARNVTEQEKIILNIEYKFGNTAPPPKK